MGSRSDRQKVIEAALRESEQRFAKLFRASPAAIDINTASEGRLIEVNDRSCEFFGYTREEMVGHTVHELQIWAAPQEREPIVRRALETGSVRDIEVKFRRKTGEIRDALLSMERIELDGQPEAVLIVTFTDITEQKRSAAALRESEERFRLLAKATNDAIWDWNLKTDRIWWSKGFEGMFGFRLEEVQPTLKWWTSRIHPEDRERVVPGALEAIRSGAEHWAGEYRFLRKDGSYAYVLDRDYVIRDESGQAVRMIGGMTDLTERREAQERIADQAALLDAAHDAIYVCDLQDRIIYWNKGAERTYAWMTAEALGRKTLELLYDGSERIKALEAGAVLMQKGAWKGELEKRAKDGRQLIIEASWTLVRDAAGKLKSILAIDTNVTEKKKMEQQFLRAQRLDSIGTVAGGIAHDLNNVLAPIRMSVQLLRMDEANPERLKFISAIESSAVRGIDLIHQLLSYARGTEGPRSAVSLLQLAHEVAEIVRETFPKTIRFQLEHPEGLWNVNGDVTQLHQVVMNLCLNARDAMAAGGTLTLRLDNAVLDEVFSAMNPEAKPGRYALLQVRDTGCGVPSEIQDQIFDPFFTTKLLGNGTGLGLSTVATIVKSHGGFIELESERDRGASFNVYFPATSGAEVVRKEIGAQADLPRGKGELILVADDEENIRFITQETLERFGYRVVVASNGAEAVALHAKHGREIAAAVIDMVMPVMDGPAAIIAMRSMDAAVKVIGSTGQDSRAVGERRKVELEHWVRKPYTAASLLKLLREVLDRQAEPA